jgi:3-oxoacyl-[acyl-carrier protein] reductase
MNIDGRLAMVTGAGAEGTGRSIALALARRSASVVVGDIDPLGGRETVHRIEAAGGRAVFVRADVRDRRRHPSDGSIGRPDPRVASTSS